MNSQTCQLEQIFSMQDFHFQIIRLLIDQCSKVKLNIKVRQDIPKF